MENLTKDCQKLIAVLYKDYLEKRESGISKAQAKCFGSSHNIHENLVPKWSFEDVDETCRELCRANMISVKWADNIANNVTISDSGIIRLENRFKNGIKDIVDFISKLIP